MRFDEIEFQSCPNCGAMQLAKNYMVVAVNELSIVEIKYLCGSYIINRLFNSTPSSEWKMTCTKPILKD